MNTGTKQEKTQKALLHFSTEHKYWWWMEDAGQAWHGETHSKGPLITSSRCTTLKHSKECWGH